MGSAGDRLNRREYLHRGTAVTAAGLSGAIAGCGGLLPWGDEVEYGTVEPPEPAATDTAHAEWIPTPSALGFGDHGRLAERFLPRLFAEPATLAASTVDFDSHLSPIRGWQEYLGLDFDAYEGVLSITGEWDLIIEAEFTPQTVGETLRGGGYTEAGLVQGYELYDRTDLPRMVAVGEDTIVFVREPMDSQYPDREQFVTGVLDAREGDGEQYHETGSGRELLEQVGRYPYIDYVPWRGYLHQIDAVPVEAVTVDDETVYLVYTLAYESGSTPSESAIQDSLEGKEDGKQWSDPAGAARAVDIDIDEPFVTVSMAFDQGQFEERHGDHSSPPLVTWGFEYDEESGMFTVSHDAGEAIPIRHLSVSPERYDELPLAVSGDSALFESGDVATFEFETGEPAFLTFEYEPGVESENRLFEYHF